MFCISVRFTCHLSLPVLFCVSLASCASCLVLLPLSRHVLLVSALFPPVAFSPHHVYILFLSSLGLCCVRHRAVCVSPCVSPVSDRWLNCSWYMLQYVTFYVFTNKDAFEFYVLLSGSSSGYHTAGLDSFCKMLHTQLSPEDEGNNNKWENRFR